MQLAVFVAAALLLSLERLTYAWVWRHPARFAARFARLDDRRDPVLALRRLFLAFKALQIAVFAAWCAWHSAGGPLWTSTGAAPIGVAAALIAAGQALNTAVFWRLGNEGVFYGVRFGRAVPWCAGFPFRRFRHPQYVGARMTIWGFFLLARYPHADWAALPMLESVYYWIGAVLEDERDRREDAPLRGEP